jgi:hypothetical protein
MSAFDFKSLYAHYGHHVKINIYGDFSEGGDIPDNRVENVAIECTCCNEVLLDFDNPDFECAPPESEPTAVKMTLTLDRPHRVPQETSYRSFLLDDEALEKVLAAHAEDPDGNMITVVYSVDVDHAREVLLDGFVCREEKRYQEDICQGVGHKTFWGADYPAQCYRFVLCGPAAIVRSDYTALTEKFLRGGYHLAYFVNGRLDWVVKMLMVSIYSVFISPKLPGVLLENSRFLGNGILDFRPADHPRGVGLSVRSATGIWL